MTQADSPPPRSLFVFRFRLLPAHACANINFQHIGVQDTGIACTRDVVGVRLSAIPQDVRPLLLAAKARVAMLLDVHAYCGYPTLPPLEVVSEGWVEVRDAADKETVFGYSDPSLESLTLVSNHPDNRPFLEAERLLAGTLSRVPDLAHAFNDFRLARQEAGSYVAFFAKRTLEDLGSMFGRDSNDRPDWARMNAALGTAKSDWDPVNQGNPRHNPRTPIPVGERAAMLDCARTAIDKYISWEKGQNFVQLTNAATTYIASAAPG